MKIDFSGKVVVVTGAANGIGRACVQRFAEDGAHVVALDIEVQALHDTINMLGGSRKRHMAIPVDLTDRERVRQVFSEIHERFDTVDVLVNNVGQSAREKGSEFASSDPEVWDFVINVCLMTTLMVSRMVVPGMINSRAGRIINIASDAALRGDVRLADYVTAKAGVMGFTRALARELADHGVTVNSVCPGPIRTRMVDRLPPETLRSVTTDIPLGDLGDPSDIANAVAFFASDAARYITGQALLINGGRIFH